LPLSNSTAGGTDVFQGGSSQQKKVIHGIINPHF
jgi:hypothetical protein